MKKLNLQIVLTALLLFQLFFGIISYGAYLHIFVDQIVNEIRSQKYEALLKGDSLEIAKEINSLIGHDYIRCAKVFSQGQELFKYEKSSPCKIFFISTSRVIENSAGDVIVNLDFKMPFMMQINFFIFILIEILMLATGALFFKKIKDREFKEISKFNYIAAKAAHDIRSPLSALSAISSSLPETYDEQRKLISNIVGRITSISKELYLLTKEQKVDTSVGLVRHRGPINILRSESQIDLVLEVKNSISEIEASHSQNGIQFGSQSNRESILINIDVDGFRRVLSNLFNNAIEAKKDDQLKINIQILASNERVIVTIHDNGKGIPPDVLKRLGKVKVSYGKGGLAEAGSGIGVLSASEFMNQQGGTFSINSRLNSGTIVSLDFPLKS